MRGARSLAVRCRLQQAVLTCGVPFLVVIVVVLFGPQPSQRQTRLRACFDAVDGISNFGAFLVLAASGYSSRGVCLKHRDGCRNASHRLVMSPCIVVVGGWRD